MDNFKLNKLRAILSIVGVFVLVSTIMFLSKVAPKPTTTPTTVPSTTASRTILITTAGKTKPGTTTTDTTDGETTPGETTTPATTTMKTTTPSSEPELNRYYEPFIGKEVPDTIFAEVFETDEDIYVDDEYKERGGNVDYLVVPKYKDSIVRIYEVKFDDAGVPQGPDYNRRLFSITIEGSGSVRVQAIGDEVFPHFVIVVTTPDKRSAKSFSHSDGRGYFDSVYYYPE